MAQWTKGGNDHTGLLNEGQKTGMRRRLITYHERGNRIGCYSPQKGVSDITTTLIQTTSSNLTFPTFPILHPVVVNDTSAVGPLSSSKDS